MFRLARIAHVRGYESPRWFTRNQAAKVGHPVREGEPGTLVVSMWYGPGADETEERIHTKGHTVFNWDQLEGAEKDGRRQTIAVLPQAQTVIDKYLRKERQRRLKLELQQSRSHDAYYVPHEDRIVVPHPDRFTDSSLYYLTAFHEAAHSTGHKKRLNRLEGNRPAPFDSHDYGQEELVAEMTAAFLAAATGLTFKGPVVEDSATYLNGWLRKMDEDPSILLKAALKAQVAFNYVLKGKRPSKRTRRRSSRK